MEIIFNKRDFDTMFNSDVEVQLENGIHVHGEIVYNKTLECWTFVPNDSNQCTIPIPNLKEFMDTIQK